MTDDEQKEIDAAVEEYLKNGGTVTVCETGARTEDLQVGQWGRRKPAAKPKPAAKSAAKSKKIKQQEIV